MKRVLFLTPNFFILIIPMLVLGGSCDGDATCETIFNLFGYVLHLNAPILLFVGFFILTVVCLVLAFHVSVSAKIKEGENKKDNFKV